MTRIMDCQRYDSLRGAAIVVTRSVATTHTQLGVTSRVGVVTLHSQGVRGSDGRCSRGETLGWKGRREGGGLRVQGKERRERVDARLHVTLTVVP